MCIQLYIQIQTKPTPLLKLNWKWIFLYLFFKKNYLHNLETTIICTTDLARACLTYFTLRWIIIAGSTWNDEFFSKKTEHGVSKVFIYIYIYIYTCNHGLVGRDWMEHVWRCTCFHGRTYSQELSQTPTGCVCNVQLWH